MKKYIFIILLFNLFMINVNATNKSDLPYEIRNVEYYSDYMIISGWGLLNESQHHNSTSTHNYELILDNGKEKIVYKSTPYELDQTKVMQVDGVRKCNSNEYNKNGKVCYYDYSYTGFKFKINYSDLTYDNKYNLSLKVNTLNNKKSSTIDLYYPINSPKSFKKGDIQYLVDSKLDDTQIKISFEHVYVRANAADKVNTIKTGNYCSYNYLNNLYFNMNSIFNNIYEVKTVNNNTYYRIKYDIDKCLNGQKVVKEGNSAFGWVVSNFVDYAGEQMSIDVKLINNKPIIHAEDIIIYDDEKFDIKDHVNVSDIEEGDLTNKLITTGSVEDEYKDYKLDLYVEDKYGASDTKTITVKRVKTKNEYPSINADNKIIYRNANFDYLTDITADDKEDGNITNKITYTGNVNTSIKGNYDITYSVTDSQNQTTTKTITVSVIDNPYAYIRFVDKNKLFYKEDVPNNWNDLFLWLSNILNINNDVLTKQINTI